MSSSQASSESEKAEVEIYGKIIQVYPDSLVIVEYYNKLVRRGISVGEFELDNLDFYTGTKVVQDFISNFGISLLDNTFTLLLANYSSTTYRSKFKCPRVLKLFQDFAHGRVYINRQIQIGIIQMLKKWSEVILQTQQQAVFLRAYETGDVWFRIYVPFQDRILNFFHDKLLPDPETLDTLMERSVHELQKEIFVAPFPPDKTMQRIQIHKIIYGKLLLNVTFLDFGVEEEIPLDQIYSASAIDENYAHFPPLAVKCHLNNIVSLDTDAFAEFIQNNPVYIQLVDPFENTNANMAMTDDDAAPSIDAFMKQNPDEVGDRLQEIIVSEGIGIPEVRNPRYSGLDWLNSISKSQHSFDS